MIKVSDLGEFGVIQHIRNLIAQRNGIQNAPFDYKLLVGVGDDTAAWRGTDAIELATTDTMVEGVHFTRSTTPWYDVGWKIMTANVSDIAAMGGLPLYAMVTLGLPSSTLLGNIDELYTGILDMAGEYQFSIVGGDLVRSPIAFITIALTGVTQANPMLRSEAHPGDLVAVVGHLGSSAGGLSVIMKGLGLDQKRLEVLVEAHRKPRPYLQHGMILAQKGVRASIDVSDGLVDDIAKLCQASQVSARIRADQVPIDQLLKQTFPNDHLRLALNGGEDYAIIFTAPPQLMREVMLHLPLPKAVIGNIFEGNSGEVTILDASGTEIPLPQRGWNHYS